MPPLSRAAARPRRAAHPPPPTTASTSPHAPSPPCQCPIDPNPASYVRTDPFTALYALRTLLGVLSSRPPPHTHRLSADEHRLALHLLTLVEPFVGLAPCPRRAALARLPTEVLDQIAWHVDARTDLAALAACCKRLRDVVWARHWEYRLVRARPGALGVWAHFVGNRALARNVRRLEVLDERAGVAREVVPPELAGALVAAGKGAGRDTEFESSGDELGLHAKQERLLLAALGRMGALRSVRWACSHSLVRFERVWAALERCASLEEVEVEDNAVFLAPGIGAESGERGRRRSRSWPESGAVSQLHGLKTVALRGTKSAFGAAKVPDLARIAAMLHQCPNLQTLDISHVSRNAPGFVPPVADDLLLCGRWAALRSLTLSALACSPGTGLDAAAAFLAAHPALEVLHLDIAFGQAPANANAGPDGGAAARLKLPVGSLPRLKELKAPRDVAAAVLSCPLTCDPEGPTRPLETVKGVRLTGPARDRPFLDALRVHGQSVRRVELAGWNDLEDVRRLAECVPKLTWLDVGRRGPAQAQTGAAGASVGVKAAHVVANAAEWTTVLQQIPELTTLHGVRFFHAVAHTDAAAPGLSLSDRSRTRKNDEVASVLAWRCPRLRRLDHWEDGAGRVVVLVRDAERVRYEVRRVKV
ncbi:uncharacterized protein BXZ73DRAFT_90263 [Epithele typhae]|uniref:uncharacterized protein n=1 Tax=Epithele typhae TaxID=378194 RepID=UPI0020087245|nr:uncharacterized protein BXZ73DRAFT_90263 [Epithele typhae]KAH9930422.1 hypothetical protein BXZ73DRAFT_90263 [Epithele typhae]